MTTELFSVFDAAANKFIDPWPGPTVEFALRGFREACEQEGHQFRKFSEDYVLYHVGTFKTDSGEMEGFPPRKIAMASSYVPAQIDIEDQLRAEA